MTVSFPGQVRVRQRARLGIPGPMPSLDNATLTNPNFSGTVKAIPSDIPEAAGTPGSYVFAKRNGNALVGIARTSYTTPTYSFNTAVTAYGVLEAASSGNNVFGLFARADAYCPGVVTNELNCFNFSGTDAPAAVPQSRAIGITNVVPVALTLAAGGTNRSWAAVDIGREGETPQGFQNGMVFRDDAITSVRIYMDATATSSAQTDFLIKNTGQGSNKMFDLQTTGAAIPSNAILTHKNATGSTTLSIFQDGSVSTTGKATFTDYYATSANYPGYWTTNTAAPTDAKTWNWYTGPDGSLVLRTINDAATNSATALTFKRVGSLPVAAAFAVPIVEPSNPPATLTSNGDTGTRTWDANYEYRCVAPNTWKRSLLTSADQAGAWTAYTPAISTTSGTLTSAAASGRYLLVGKLLHINVVGTITTNGSGAGLVLVSLPSGVTSAALSQVVSGVEYGSNKSLSGRVNGGSSNLVIQNTDGSYAGGNGTSLVLTGAFEVQ